MKKLIVVSVLLMFGVIMFVNSQQVVELGTVVEDYYLRVTKGDIPGQSHINKFGANPAVGTTPEVIWDGGNGYYYRDTATVLNLSSSSTADTYGGAAAWTVQIQGLDGNYDLVNEEVNLSGQTIVTTTNQYIRVFRMLVTKSGNGNNNGDLYLYNGSATSGVPNDAPSRWAMIQAGNGQTLMSLYTIPAGKSGYLLKGYATSAGNKNVNIKYFNRPQGAAKQVKFDFDMLNSPFIYEFGVPSGPIPEKTDLWVEASIDAGTTKVSTGFDIILIDN